MKVVARAQCSATTVSAAAAVLDTANESRTSCWRRCPQDLVTGSLSGEMRGTTTLSAAMVRASEYFSVVWGLHTQSEPPLGLGVGPVLSRGGRCQGIALLERIYATPSLSGRREWSDWSATHGSELCHIRATLDQ